MSVEFRYAELPRQGWVRQLAGLKDMGITHVSLAVPRDDAQLDDVIRIVRRLGLEADLEGVVPEGLQALTKAHGGPLTEPLAGVARISALDTGALAAERKLLVGGAPSILWTDVFETLSPYRAGGITLAGSEGVGAALIRREAQLARFWGATLASLPEVSGARTAVAADGVAVRQFVSEKGPPISMAAIVNDSAAAWKGDIRVLYPAVQRAIALASIAVPGRDVLWLPVNIPLTAGPLCVGCNGFAPSDHLIYATAELTDMEYENGILAMEFTTATPGEAVLQLSHEPVGPLVAGGRPAIFDWDPKTQRARLPIPAGNAKTGRVRVALAVDAPAATAFFQNPPALIIGETSHLHAEFSPPGVAARSRVRTSAEMTVVPVIPEKPPVSLATPPEDKDKPVMVVYNVSVPATAVAGDVAQLSIEADGMQLSHAQLRLLPAVTVSFADAVSVRVAAGSTAAVTPATVPVNQKPGREITLSIRNNAPEIRTFDVALNAPGLEFSPEKLTVSVGASVAREITFRVFSGSAVPGLHEGMVRISGGAALSEPVRFVVLPAAGGVAWGAEGFSILESVRLRATFMGDIWLEMIDKDSGHDSQPVGGTAYSGSAAALRPEDLERLKTSAK